MNFGAFPFKTLRRITIPLVMVNLIAESIFGLFLAVVFIGRKMGESFRT